MIEMPKTLDFGFGELTEVSYLEQVFKIKRRSAIKYLKVLHIKPFYIGKDVYFSLITFKRVLFVLSKPGARGFIFPGSAQKNNPRTVKNPDYLTEVTDVILEQAADPKILSEMAGCTGDNPSILSKFIANPVGRPSRKERKDGRM